MSNKINELVNQEMDNHYYALDEEDSGYYGPEAAEASLKAFAELIVSQCVTYIKENADEVYANPNKVFEYFGSTNNGVNLVDINSSVYSMEDQIADYILENADDEPRAPKRFNLADIQSKFVKPTEADILGLGDTYTAYRYAKEVIGGRWPEAEGIIMTDAYCAALYSKDVIGGRWEEAEGVIMENDSASVIYALYVIKGRWEPGEDSISNNPYSSAVYAIDVLHAPFDKGLAAINSDEISKESYYEFLSTL